MTKRSLQIVRAQLGHDKVDCKLLNKVSQSEEMQMTVHYFSKLGYKRKEIKVVVASGSNTVEEKLREHVCMLKVRINY